MICYIFLSSPIQQDGVGVIKRLKRYKTSSPKPTVAKHQQHKQPPPPPNLQAVQQLAILDAVLETTARLTRAATVIPSATTSTTAVMTSHPLAATVSALHAAVVCFLHC